jgi:acid phosphatase
MVIVMENHEYSSIIGSSSAPYINSLAQQYGLATGWDGVSHPSLPNYLALTSGSTQGVTNDGTGYVFNVENLADELGNAGISWKAYMEDMPSPCYNGGTSGNYAKKHNPFMYYADILNNPAQCNRDVPFTQFATDLTNNTAPSFMWVTPNLMDDMHNGTVQQGDTWLKSQMATVMASQWYQSGGKVIVTWDEGSTSTGGGGHIATLVVSATSHGQLATAGNHYGTLRAIEETYGIGLAGSSASSANGDLRSMF